MKLSSAVAAPAISAALPTLVLAETPKFLNSKFHVTEGQTFTLNVSGCDPGCTITLEPGTGEIIQPVKTLTSSATGGSFTFTPEDLLPGTYNFQITDNFSGESSDSPSFLLD